MASSMDFHPLGFDGYNSHSVWKHLHRLQKNNQTHFTLNPVGLGASVKELPPSSLSLSLPPGKHQQGHLLAEQWWSSVGSERNPKELT